MLSKHHQLVVSMVLVMFLTVVGNGDAPGPNAEGDFAHQVLKATELRGGLIVHLDCGDGTRTASFQMGNRYLIQGLDTDAEEIRQARENLRELGLYGQVTVMRFNGEQLPYTDNLVNLVVAENLGGVPVPEAMRVLAPGGVLYVKRNGRWSKNVKPRPTNIDEWTHYNHDASGNAVAQDAVVGPPRYLQWTAEPRHTLCHEYTPGINSLVSNGGQIFYIVDQAPIDSVLRAPQWHLVARDAFNGILLWERPLSVWFPHLVNWGQVPRHLQRRLVAVGNRVYVTLNLHAPLTALDAVTGETLLVYENTRGTEEIICHQGILLLAVRSVTEERTAELAKMEQLTFEKESPLHNRDSAQPLVSQFRKIENRGAKSVLALEAESGRLLWKKTGEEAGGLRPLSLCAEGDRAYYQNGRDVICIDLRTGRECWSTSAPALRLVYAGSVLCAADRTVTALSVQNGKTRWKQATLVTQIRDLFVADGSLWVGGFKPIKGKRGPSWGPYFVTQRDLKTGTMVKHIEPENPGHHHRCYANKATSRYILGGRRGTEFIDLASGEVLWHSWARGVCKYGVMPANGLLYAPPHACGCYMAAKLTGFNALASVPATNAAKQTASLERGSAYGHITAPRSRGENRKDWPTYRHDPRRSGFTPFPVSAKLHRKWQINVGGKLTSPTVAEGKVWIAGVEDHRVLAIDADSGQSVWSFTAGARVDSPPTLYRNRAIFGCRDGNVYSLRASDGALAWRLPVACSDRRIVASTQLESALPVHGSVLIREGLAYCTAGRSSYLDGGIQLYRLEVETGKILSKTRIYSPDPQTGKQPPQYGPNVMPGARMDILTGDDNHVYLRDMVFDPYGVRRAEGTSHLFTLTGFLDDTWAHRSYWIFGDHCSIATGCSRRDRDLVFGRLLVFNESTIYGYGRTQVHWSNSLQDGAYRLFAVKQGEKTKQWSRPLPIRVRAMILAGEVLFAAGPIDDMGDRPAARDGSRGAVLLALSASNGVELARYRLDGSPVFDGMGAADGRLYISLENGRLLCLAGEGKNEEADIRSES